MRGRKTRNDTRKQTQRRCERTLTTLENASRNAVREWDSQNIKSILPFNCCKHSTESNALHTQHFECTQNHIIA